MVVNWGKVRKVVLNDRYLGYKPDKQSLKLLVEKLPDAKVVGFGIYQSGIISKIWYLLVESRYFFEDEQPGFAPVGILGIPNIVPRKLSPPVDFKNNPPDKPSA